jgi:hypothetical protein
MDGLRREALWDHDAKGGQDDDSGAGLFLADLVHALRFKVMLLDCYVDFVKNWERDYNLNQIGLDGRIRDKDAEEIKKRLAAEFTKVFTKELTKKGFEVVDDTGADVLLLRPALINVDVVAPDVLSAGIRNVVISSAGAMTLYMEMYDSSTSTLIARVIDPKADREGLAQVANRVTNKVAADQMLRHWADLLARHLGSEMHGDKKN